VHLGCHILQLLEKKGFKGKKSCCETNSKPDLERSGRRGLAASALGRKIKELLSMLLVAQQSKRGSP